MQLIIVGAGGTCRELLRRLGEMWHITVVDASAERLSLMEGFRGFAPVEGDGSSRLVLERAGLADADAVVAATDDDDANLEVCRLATQANVLRVVAVAADRERAGDYRRMGVRAISPAGLTARQIELALETRRVASKAFAEGRAEAIEFRLEPDSPILGKPLKELGARGWLAGAVLRGDQLLIPHGETVLQPGDLVTVVGSAQELPDVLRLFTAGEPRFPLDYGKRVATALASEADIGPVFAEAVRLAGITPASSLLVAYPDPDERRADVEPHQIKRLLEEAQKAAGELTIRWRPVAGKPERALTRLAVEESVGLVVLPASSFSGLGARLALRGPAAMVRRMNRPLVSARSGAAYVRIVVAARPTPAGRAAARAAIEVAALAKVPLVVVSIEEPVFLPGSVEHETRQAAGWVTERAAGQGVEVERVERRDNPVRVLRDVAQDGDLLVVGVSVDSGRAGVNVVDHLARRAPCSVLAVPSEA